MLKPGSVAIVGASERPGSVGNQTLRQLVAGGFRGRLHLVNPGHTTIEGRPCLASLDEVDDTIDLVALAVGNQYLETEMEKAVGIGARSVAIFASCHGEARDGGLLRDRLAELANDAGVPICGGNGMGFLNVTDGVRVCGFYQPPVLIPGGITFLSHSGSLFSAMLHNGRDLRFDLVVSTGLELNTTMDRYLGWALDQGTTGVVGIFLETVRDPNGLVEVLDRAQSALIPVVALKVGVSRRGQAAVATHSAAIAGEDSVYQALFDRYGVHRVETMDEMTDTLELLSTGKDATANGLGAVHDSGGERALLIDTAERVGVPLPALGTAATTALGMVLDPGLEPANPVDAWGTGRDATTVFTECLRALAADQAIGAVAFCVDLTAEESLDHAYSRAALQAHASTDKPLMVIANLSTTVDPDQAAQLRAGGVPVLEGTETALRAVRHLLDRHLRSTWPPPAPRLTTPRRIGPVVEGERAAIDLLSHYGIATPMTVVADDEAGALIAAERIGYPVVLKTVGVAHKTDVGGVRLGLHDATALGDAYREMSRRLGPRVTVSSQLPAGLEMAVGMVTDPQFGPVVLVSVGGTLIEVLADPVALLPPVDVFRARQALDGMRLQRLWEGHRGSSAVEIGAVAELIARFSELVVDAVGVVSSIDLNPVIVGPNGVTAVDVLLVAP
jgi:acyl-CoA synthetase (NDP forming)